MVPAYRIFPRNFLRIFCICCLISCDFHDPPVRSALRPARKEAIEKLAWKVAIEKLATKLADLRAELEAARREVRAMRATADGLNYEVIKLAAEKAALQTELTTRTAAWSQMLVYKYKTEKAGSTAKK